MKRQIVVYVVVLLVGLGIGLASGSLITKSKIDESNVLITNLQAEMQNSQAMSQEKIQNADAVVVRLNSELMRVRTELEQLKASREQTVTSPAENTVASGTTDSTLSTSSTLYTVKEGDSFWKIAASQLGDGSRYKEIIKLNPDISPNNKDLAVGMKLKIPTK